MYSMLMLRQITARTQCPPRLYFYIFKARLSPILVCVRRSHFLIAEFVRLARSRKIDQRGSLNGSLPFARLKPISIAEVVTAKVGSARKSMLNPVQRLFCTKIGDIVLDILQRTTPIETRMWLPQPNLSFDFVTKHPLGLFPKQL